MSEKTAYCEKCGKEVPYIIEDIELTEVIGDEKRTYPGKIARCKYCGTEVKVDGEDYTIVKQDDILAIVE